MKKEYLILAAVIVGLSIYLFARKTDRALYELPQLPEVSGKKISKIEISGPEGTTVLNRADEDWRIGPQKYPASKNKVQQMIDTIEDLKLTALISEAKDYIRYDLSDDKKISVKAWIGDSLSREFEVGKAASSFQHTFVKLAGDPKVYHARDNFRNKFDQDVNDLRDKSVLSFTVSDIQEVKLVAVEHGQNLTGLTTVQRGIIKGGLDPGGPQSIDLIFAYNTFLPAFHEPPDQVTALIDVHSQTVRMVSQHYC